MFNFARFRSFILPAWVTYVFLATGCGTQPSHPNQLNAFDGASYDTLTLARGALTSLRVPVSTSYPKYTPLFNQAADSYAAAYNAYAVYRTNPSDSAAVTIAITNLTFSIIALENSLQTDMQVPPAIVLGVRKKAQRLQVKAAGQSVTVSDILTELEIAAAIARAIPAASVYAGIAAMVIQTTNAALAAESANAGQPINLASIQPVAAI